MESVGGTDLELQTVGDGPPLLFLHGEDGLLFAQPFLGALAERFTVTAPGHPGWGRSPRTPRFRSLDDVAYVYLDLLERLGGPVHVVGCSIGAWLGMEMATKCTHSIASLALVAPVGIRVGEPTRRYYLDLYASAPDEVAGALYGNPARRPDLASLSEHEFAELAAAQEATTFYGWEPYMHSPSLLERLRRVRVPTLLVTGDRDGFVLAPEHLDTLAAHLAGPTEMVRLPGIGHRVEEEAPDDLARVVTSSCRIALGDDAAKEKS